MKISSRTKELISYILRGTSAIRQTAKPMGNVKVMGVKSVML
jgi:hypothetical protein